MTYFLVISEWANRGLEQVGLDTTRFMGMEHEEPD